MCTRECVYIKHIFVCSNNVGGFGFEQCVPTCGWLCQCVSVCVCVCGGAGGGGGGACLCVDVWM